MFTFGLKKVILKMNDQIVTISLSEAPNLGGHSENNPSITLGTKANSTTVSDSPVTDPGSDTKVSDSDIFFKGIFIVIKVRPHLCGATVYSAQLPRPGIPISH